MKVRATGALVLLQAAFGGADEELSLIAQERVQLQHQAYVSCAWDHVNTFPRD